ncbi:hypothetical protein PPYR_02287 [Photinus pyralis]|uniref:DDE-1 domain-containing protein n=1 Tax=Photinus pyralis TaxID=7054 RepID=A0A5N4B6T6_PHOPY|nr:hypothetical protein PPYR_02287 [Photinus pyralis]
MVRSYKRQLGSRPYQNYSVEVLRAAVADVKSNKKSIREASEFYGIPKSTIGDKVKGTHDKNPGRQPVLNTDEEANLAHGISTAATWGFPLVEYDVRKVVQSYLNRKGVQIDRFSDHLPGVDWVKKFLSVPPENIINYDETNFSDDPGRVKIVCKRGSKNCDRVIDATKTSISVMMAASPSGTLLPPFVVYKAKHRYQEWEENGPLGCRYSCTPSGWFDARAFGEWFQEIVLPYYRNKEGKKLMIGDNLSSHITLDVIQKCEENNITFALLPANSTHVCQPLDVAYFGWRRILTDWKLKRRGPFQKSDFPTLLNRTLNEIKATSEKNIISGFRATGIWPLNADQVLKRIPRQQDENNDPNASLLSDSLLDILKTSRMPEPKTKTKRKRINVTAGKAVEIRDFSAPEAILNQVGQEVDLEDFDDEPLSVMRDQILEKKRLDLLEAGPSHHDDFPTEHFEEENLTDSNLKDKPEVQNVKPGMFVIVKVPIEHSSDIKYYAAKVIEKVGEDTESPLLQVRFLRKKKD